MKLLNTAKYLIFDSNSHLLFSTCISIKSCGPAPIRPSNNLENKTSDVSRVFLGRPVTSWSSPPPFRDHGWQKFLSLVPPDTLKMHSLAVLVLRFLCKTVSKLHKLNNKTLFSVDV